MSAADALRLAMRWQGEIDLGGIRRADIARRERLLELPAEVKALPLAGHAEVEGWSVRRALREVG